MNNKLLIAGAGTGKTTYLIEKALETKEKTLITTFTINCKNEIINKIIKEKRIYSIKYSYSNMVFNVITEWN